MGGKRCYLHMKSLVGKMNTASMWNANSLVFRQLGRPGIVDDLMVLTRREVVFLVGGRGVRRGWTLLTGKGGLLVLPRSRVILKLGELLGDRAPLVPGLDPRRSTAGEGVLLKCTLLVRSARDATVVRTLGPDGCQGLSCGKA